MMFFSTLAYSQKNLSFLHSLFAFATNPELRRIPIPRYVAFDIPAGYGVSTFWHPEYPIRVMRAGSHLLAS
jgi:hypothetical protein